MELHVDRCIGVQKKSKQILQHLQPASCSASFVNVELLEREAAQVGEPDNGQYQTNNLVLTAKVTHSVLDIILLTSTALHLVRVCCWSAVHAIPSVQNFLLRVTPAKARTWHPPSQRTNLRPVQGWQIFTEMRLQRKNISPLYRPIQQSAKMFACCKFPPAISR